MEGEGGEERRRGSFGEEGEKRESEGRGGEGRAGEREGREEVGEGGGRRGAPFLLLSSPPSPLFPFSFSSPSLLSLPLPLLPPPLSSSLFPSLRPLQSRTLALLCRLYLNVDHFPEGGVLGVCCIWRLASSPLSWERPTLPFLPPPPPRKREEGR